MAYRWIVIAKDFPPTLNSQSPATDLKENETPDAYGLDVDSEGCIVAGSCPTGTARAVKTYTVDATTYSFFHKRLWAASSNALVYGAPYYTESLFAQGPGKILLPEVTGASAIVAFMPIGDTSLGIVTTSGGYLVGNAASLDGRFVVSHLIEEVAASTASHVTEMDGTVYVSNASGIFAWSAEGVEELTFPVRNALTGFASVELKADYKKRRIIGTGTCVVDVATKRLLRYSGTAFRYTTPTVQSDQARPLSVTQAAFHVEHTGTGGGAFTIQFRHEDQDWTVPREVLVPYVGENYTRIVTDVDSAQMCKKWTARLTALSGLKIKEIQAYAEGYRHGDYTV